MSRLSLITKGFINLNRKFGLLQIAVVLLLLAATGIVSVASYSNAVENDLADSLLRFHVIANSDSDTDQEMKRAVRDAINLEMKSMLKDSQDIEQTKAIIGQNLSKIEKIALDVVEKYQADYPVKAMLGRFSFPTKVYGNIMLPSGEYQALRIVIGKGEGANWWCVLFPPLCFVDATHGTIPDSVKEDLKNVLTSEEYDLITTADNEDDVPVRIKFKIVEIYQESTGRISTTFSNLFKKVQID